MRWWTYTISRHTDCFCLFYYHRSTTGTTMQVNNKLNTIMKTKVKRNANQKSNHNITAFFFNLQKQNTTILSDIHGRKKQKHFGLFTFLSLCTNSLIVGSLTWNWSAYIRHMQQHSSSHATSSLNGSTIQLWSTNYWGCRSKVTFQKKNPSSFKRILVLQNKTGPAEM